jgi:uncharacterized protein DUF3572
VSVETPNDPHALALAALAATLADDRRARRFLELTGIGTEELRCRAGDPVLLAALIAFLEAHEPDLVSVSEAIGVEPGSLAAIRRDLEGSE